MTCEFPFPIYISHSKAGIVETIPKGDGYTVSIDWKQAYAEPNNYSIIYNIYYSTSVKNVFLEGVKAVSVQDGTLTADILDLTPGDVYYFAVRATEFDPSWYNPALLPDGFPNLKVYPESVLTSNISASDLVIPIVDIDQFPSKGIIQIGLEIIQYSSRDIPSSTLIVQPGGRGFLATEARPHAMDGYDGVETQNAFVKFWKGYEEHNTAIMMATNEFTYPNYAFTKHDGYRTITDDLVNTDLSASDANQVGFMRMDYVGWRRTDPASLLNGDCVGTYLGGEQFCADGYGVGFQLRGVPLNVESNRRQEELLELTGEPVVLARRLYKGITCKCIESTTQNPNLRCVVCHGVGFVSGYEQYINPRRSDGRILVRFDATDDEVKIEEDGLESKFTPNCWTLVVPSIKSRDFIIRFNEDGTEEFRYEVISVTRNKLLNSISGAQKFKVQRMRKTDPIYSWGAVKKLGSAPQKITTSIGFLAGPNGTLIPHTHDLWIDENTYSVSQINQTTSVSAGHNHEIRNGIVQDEGLHTHTIILP